MPSAYTFTLLLVVAVALLILIWLAYRKFKRVDPERAVAARLKTVGFREYPTLAGPAPSMYDRPFYSLYHKFDACPSCAKKVYALGRWYEEKDEVGYPHWSVEVFGTACPNCQNLEKMQDCVPEPFRHAWTEAADLPDFLRRVAHSLPKDESRYDGSFSEYR